MLKKIEKQCKELGVPLILGDAKEVIESLVKQNKPKKVLEIGSGIGFSGAVICSAFKGAHLTTVELDKARHAIAKENLKNFNAVCINADCCEFLAANKEKFDFVFLDGPKGRYEFCLPYIVKALNKGGIFVADNIFFHGMVTGETPVTKGCRSMINHLQNFLENVKTYKELKTEILNKADGILIGKKM